MPSGENVKWIIVEVVEEPAGPAMFIAPLTLKLEAGYVGELVWYVFTPGWQLAPTKAIQFEESGFAGDPQPDPSRPSCWSTVTANEQEGTFPYFISVQRLSDGAVFTHQDPVVENEPPPSNHCLSSDSQLSAAS